MRVIFNYYIFVKIFNFITIFDDAKYNTELSFNLKNREHRKAEIKSLNPISISPNPTTGKVTITSDLQVERIIIHDTKGIKWRQIDGNVHALDISDLANGVYYVTIFTQDAQQCVKKIIKIQ